MGRRSCISRDAGLQEAGEGVGVGVGEEGRDFNNQDIV